MNYLYDELTFYTCTMPDRLYRAKDTINWFAGCELFDLGTIYIE